MRKTIYKWRWLGLVLMIGLMLFLAAQATQIQTVKAQVAVPPTGIVCTTDPGTSPTFTLTTKTGYISLPDATTMFMWGYSNGSDGFQHPGPVLCVNQGDTVTVVMHNTLAEEV